MGEKSKSSGEVGEQVALNFFTLLGWNVAGKGFDIKCRKNNLHKSDQAERQTHGIDYLVKYECPLVTGIQENLIISVKYRQKYPANPTSTFKDFLKDLSQTIECFKFDEKSALQVSDRITKIKNTGIIIWLAYEDDNDKDIISSLTDFRNTDDLQYDCVYLVDNKRANFIIETINYAKKVYSLATVNFYYPDTGLNSRQIDSRKSAGDQMPVQYINSSIIPLKIEKDGEEILLLSVCDQFTEEHLTRIIGLSQKLTEGWGNKIVICFPDFHKLTHENVVNMVKTKFQDIKFIKKIEVKSLRDDFKNLEGN